MTLTIEIPEGYEWDSESDRRDYYRQRCVEECIRSMDRIIEAIAPTKTAEETALLEIRVATRLLQRIESQAILPLYRREIADAEAKL